MRQSRREMMHAMMVALVVVGTTARTETTGLAKDCPGAALGVRAWSQIHKVHASLPAEGVMAAEGVAGPALAYLEEHSRSARSPLWEFGAVVHVSGAQRPSPAPEGPTLVDVQCSTSDGKFQRWRLEIGETDSRVLSIETIDAAAFVSVEFSTPSWAPRLNAKSSESTWVFNAWILGRSSDWDRAAVADAIRSRLSVEPDFKLDELVECLANGVRAPEIISVRSSARESIIEFRTFGERWCVARATLRRLAQPTGDIVWGLVGASMDWTARPSWELDRKLEIQVLSAAASVLSGANSVTDDLVAEVGGTVVAPAGPRSSARELSSLRRRAAEDGWVVRGATLLPRVEGAVYGVPVFDKTGRLVDELEFVRWTNKLLFRTLRSDRERLRLDCPLDSRVE